MRRVRAATAIMNYRADCARARAPARPVPPSSLAASRATASPSVMKSDATNEEQ